MRNNFIIATGVFLLLICVVIIFVFKSSASEDSIYLEECTPFNVEVRKAQEENSAKISWISKGNCSGYILYGKEMRNLDMVGVDLTNETQSNIHEVVIKGLVSTKRYYFTIISNGTSYGKGGLPLQFSIDSL